MGTISTIEHFIGLERRKEGLQINPQNRGA